jgi:hypothetical protein
MLESISSRLLPMALVLGASLCFAQSSAKESTTSEKEAAILELGPAMSRSFTDNQSAFGPTVGVEITPIENWLELEAGVTSLFRRHSTEWSVDFLFKKPWTVSKKMELMLGVGPEWIQTREDGMRKNSFALELAPDFMFWPSGRHRFGWYLEPSYEHKFGPMREQSIGIAGGLLISIP